MSNALRPAAPVKASLPRLEALQALRFFAAFAVLVHHSLTAFGPPLTNVLVGAAGVDVFFVISGVVIGYADHNDGALAFAAKRVIRVLPLYWIATIVYGIFRYYVWNDDPTWERILRSIFLIPNFSGPWVPIYYPAWTLCFELAFYSIFGLLLPLTGRNTTLAAALVATSIAALPIHVPWGAGALFNTSPCLEFAAGLFMAEAWRRGFMLPPRLGAAAVILAVVGFVARSYDAGDQTRLLYWGVPAVLLVIGCLSLEKHSLFRWKPLILAGDASYSLYLFHIPAAEGSYMLLTSWGLDLHTSMRFIALREFVCLGAALGVGLIVHLWLETPLLRRLRHFVPHRRAPL